MSYQIIKSGTDTRAVGPHDVVKNIDSLSQVQEKTVENKISKKRIVNHLNFINFQNDAIKVNLKHKRFDRIVTLQAKPHPCTGDKLFGEWVDPAEIKQRLNTYEFENISLDHGNQSLLVQPKLINIDASGISLELSELYYPLCFESNIRQPCSGIKAQLIQNSVVFIGTLTDFCPASFHVNISLTPPQTSQWINSDSNVEVILSDEVETLYSGMCSILNHEIANDNVTVLLEPNKNEIHRFKSKKFRTKREDISPAPNIFFQHPFTKQIHDLKVINLSGLGFSVEETLKSEVLLPGMILPRVEMKFANSFKIIFKAQVIYRKNLDMKRDIRKQKTRLGLVILDIESQDHLKLLSFLHQSNDKNSYICNDIDMDSLWNFFFESNFIYPEKYNFLQLNKDEIRTTYNKIYKQNSDIARHFTYQDNGFIASHLAMIRFYENTWLIHHHASNRLASFRAGLIVLNQIGLFSNDAHNLYSSHMNYLICYFRPENKFPNRVFGGATKSINNERKCSLESFTYFHFNRQNENKPNIPWSWGLTLSNNDDIEELNAYYKHHSGGLMLKALDLENIKNSESICVAFNKSGLKRDRHIYSLRKDGHLKAIIMVNITNAGLNLSDLTNCATFIVIDQDQLNTDIIETALSLLSAELNLENFPVLFYPFNFAASIGISKERVYNLWILDTQYGDNYFNYVNRLTRLI